MRARESGTRHYVLSCDEIHARQILENALNLGMINRRYSWTLTSLNADAAKLTDHPTSAVNISMISLEPIDTGRDDDLASIIVKVRTYSNHIDYTIMILSRIGHRQYNI